MRPLSHPARESISEQASITVIPLSHVGLRVLDDRMSSSNKVFNQIFFSAVSICLMDYERYMNKMFLITLRFT
jgi:hypothetical protein